jgi:hypothetical protein
MAKNNKNNTHSLRVKIAEPSSEALSQSTSVDESLSGKIKTYASDPSEHKTVGLPFSAYFLSCLVILTQAGLRLSSEVFDEYSWGSIGITKGDCSQIIAKPLDVCQCYGHETAYFDWVIHVIIICCSRRSWILAAEMGGPGRMWRLYGRPT